MIEQVTIAVASSVISSLLKNLGTLALNELKFLEGSHSIAFKLGAIQTYLKNAGPLERHKVREIERVTYCAADAVEKMQWLQQRMNQETGCTGALPRFYHFLFYYITMYRIGPELNELSKLIPGIFDEKNPTSSNSGESSSAANDQFENLLSEDPRKKLYISGEVVGFDNRANEILRELERPNEKLSVVSIWGMGGIGKSTLAKKVFTAANKEHFPIKIWITISQNFDVLNLRKKILRESFKIKDEDLEKMTDEGVNNKLCEFLKKERYLIVLDDIWEIKSWDTMYFVSESRDEHNPRTSVFSDENNGSRIILTTRKQSVAKHPDIETFVHQMQPLSDDEGLKLLKNRAFPSYMKKIPNKNELEQKAKELAKRCEGLPLALVVLGGYLSKHLDYRTWDRMSKSIDWVEAGNQKNIFKILALSYDDLPMELKPIFLYITVFSEDLVIKSSDLIKLWIAEGLIPRNRKYKLETTARLCLDQLYERSLIQVVKWSRAHERISTIRIHDVLRDWGKEKAEEEGFFKVINKNDISTAPDEHIPYRAAFDGYWDQNCVASMPHLHTLLSFISPEDETSFDGLNSLRVVSFNRAPLKFRVSRLRYNIDCIRHMIFLRYLCLRNCGKFHLPSSIGQLSNLQTLDCRKSYIRSLPSSLWEISTLRHAYLQILECSWYGPRIGFGKKLQTLMISLFINWEHLDYWNLVAEALEEMNQIVHLNLDFGTSGTSLPQNILSKITRLFCLEVLRLSRIEGLTIISDGILPKNLVKVVLNCHELKKDPMPIFMKLTQLVVLKLEYNLHLKKLHCPTSPAGGFPRLKYFMLYNFEKLEQWTVCKDAMPILCHVKLGDCKNLKLFPKELMDHSQLQLLELVKTPMLYEADYSNLENKEPKCKVILTEDWSDTRLSDL